MLVHSLLVLLVELLSLGSGFSLHFVDHCFLLKGYGLWLFKETLF
jgi:hypothetical protein